MGKGSPNAPKTRPAILAQSHPCPLVFACVVCWDKTNAKGDSTPNPDGGGGAVGSTIPDCTGAPSVEIGNEASGVLVGKPGKTGVALGSEVLVGNGVSVSVGVSVTVGVSVAVEVGEGVFVVVGTGVWVIVGVFDEVDVGVGLRIASTCGKVGGGNGLNGTCGFDAMTRLAPQIPMLLRINKKVMRSKNGSRERVVF